MNNHINILLAVLAGILAGSIHVLTGPDHLAAIAPFTANQPKKGWRVGLWWGMGHTGSVWLIAIIIFLLKGILPLSGMSQWGDRLVGLVLIGLGLYGINKAFNSRIHYHIHEHNGLQHTHVHAHGGGATHHHLELKQHKHTHAPLGIGLLHGLAGSSHLIAIIPALALPGQYSAAGYVTGFGIGTIIAMVSFSWLIGLFQGRIIHRFAKGYQWMQMCFSSLAISVGIVWLLIN